MFKFFFQRLFATARKSRLDSDLRDELESHLDALTQENLRRGLSPAEARAAARREFGGFEQTRQLYREQRGLPFLDNLAQDIRYALRGLANRPGFAAVAILTLALGIGANTAIFSILNSVLFRPLPFPNADAIVDLTEYSPAKVDTAGVPYPDYLVWKQQNTVFDQTAAYFLINASNDVVLGTTASAERVRYSTVTNSFFEILGVHPVLGSGFSPRDEVPGGPKVFLASNALWRDTLGSDPHAIGKTYLLDGELYTLVGILPVDFDFPKGCAVWIPTSAINAAGLNDRVSHPYHVLGRLRAGITLAQAQAQVESIQKRLGELYPKTDADWHVRAQPLLDQIVGNVRPSLYILLGAVVFILLIACVNVINLMLARDSAREREFAVRSALGATRARLFVQSLTETSLIVLIGLSLGLALADWSMAVVVRFSSLHLPRMQSLRLDPAVLLFLCAVAGLTTLVVGVFPALQASQHDPQGALHQNRSNSGAPRVQRLRDALVISEIALALLLLCGAGLMLRSFAQLLGVNPGFRTEHLLTMKIALPGATYPKFPQTAAFTDRLLERLNALPGLQTAAASTTLPLNGESDWNSFQFVDSNAAAPQDWAHAPKAGGGAVTPNYFQALGIPLLRGREFTLADAQAKNAVIVNQSFAKQFLSGGDPLGRQIIFVGAPASPSRIVGIVADVRSSALDANPGPEIYSPYAGAWYINLILRTSQDPASVTSAVAAQLAALDKGVPLYQVATMDQLLHRSLAPQRFNSFLLALFAALALGLAVIGIYGVLSFSVARRTSEMGIRLALGASPLSIVALVLRRGVRLVLAGLVFGLLASALLTRLMSRLLYKISATDPLTFAAVALLLALVALAACYLPARRASRLDPIAALRCE